MILEIVENDEKDDVKLKNLTIKVDSDFHMQLKIHATKKGLSIKDYLVSLAKQDMAKNEEK